MINSYMMLTPTMQYFGSTVDETFAGAIESAILITVDEMCEEKKARHRSDGDTGRMGVQTFQSVL